MLTDIRSDVARLRQSLGKPEGNCRLERGQLYRLKNAPDDARLVVDFFQRTGLWFKARERVASGPNDHGHMCPSGGELPGVEQEVEAVGNEYELVMTFGAIFLPRGVDPNSVRIPEGIDFGHVEHEVRDPTYFCHHLESLETKP